MKDYDGDFAVLVARARAGNPNDLQLVVSQFEPELTRAIQRRRRAQGPRTWALYESMDCLQSVLGGFYKKVANHSEQLEITSFEILKRLLLKMIRDKLVDYERRVANKPTQSDTFSETVDEDGLTPSEIASQNEELNSLSDGLSENDNHILELYRSGHTSKEIAEMVEGPSSRSIRRFLKQLKDGFSK